MSAEIVFKVKKKGLTPDTTPDLLFLSTTPARELSSEVDLVFCGNSDDEYDGWTVLSIDKLKEIIAFYSNKIEEINQSVEKILKEVNEYKDQMPKAVSIELYREIRDERDALLGYIDEYNDELDMYTRLKYDFINLENIATDYCNRDFEVIYYYC